MDPAIANLDTVFAYVLVGLRDRDLVKVELVLVGFGILAVGLGMRFNSSRGRNDGKGD
jgi:hypothetical protein